MNATTIEILCPSWCTTSHDTWQSGMLEHEAVIYDVTESAPGYLPYAPPQTTSVYVFPGDPDPTINVTVPDQMTSEQARRLAAALLRAADAAELNEPERSTFVTISWPDPDAVRAAWQAEGITFLRFQGGDPNRASLQLGGIGDPEGLAPHLLVSEQSDKLDEITMRAEAALADPEAAWACSNPGDNWEIEIRV